jgi:hypothetical protein
MQKAVDEAQGRVRPGERTVHVLLKRAAANLELKRHDQVIADATLALSLPPPSAQAYLLRAAAYDALGKRALAEADRQRAGQRK